MARVRSESVDFKPFASSSMDAVGPASFSAQPAHPDKKDTIEANVNTIIHNMESFWPTMNRCFARDPVCEGTHDEAILVISREENFLKSLEERLQSACARAKANIGARRNNISSVYTVPQDVLLDIFSRAANGAADHEGSTIINISRTCAYWRFVASNNPSLWSTLNLSRLSGPQAAILASTSKNHPLHVILSDSFSTSEPPIPWVPNSETDARTTTSEDENTIRLRFCKTILHRIKHLDVSIEEGRSMPLVGFPTGLADLEAPQLETLTVTWYSRSVLPHRSVHTVEHLFDGKAPRLQSLALHNVFVPWSTLARMTTLRTLHMTLGKRLRCPPNEDEKFYMVLKACPQLEDFSFTCHEKLRGASPSSQLIALPSLRSLNLALMSSDVSTILSSIITPVVMNKLHIACMPQFGDEDRLLKLPTDPRCLPCVNNLTRFSIFPQGVFSGAFDSSGPHTVRLALEDQADSVAVADTFSRLVKHYPMPRLKTFTMKRGRDWHSAVEGDIIFFLRMCPNVVNLHIDKTCLSLAKLTPHLSHPVSPLCLSLRFVRIRHTTAPLADLVQFCRIFFSNSTYEIPMVAVDSEVSVETLSKRHWGVLCQDVAGVQKVVWLHVDDTVLTAQGQNRISRIAWNKLQ